MHFRIEQERFVWEKDGETYSAPVRPAADGAPDRAHGRRGRGQGGAPSLTPVQPLLRPDDADVPRALPSGRQPPLQDDGDIDTAVAGLHAMVEDGLAGLYQNPIPGWPGFDDYHTPRFDPVWREVERLKLPVYAMGFVSTGPRLHRRSPR